MSRTVFVGLTMSNLILSYSTLWTLVWIVAFNIIELSASFSIFQLSFVEISQENAKHYLTNGAMYPPWPAGMQDLYVFLTFPNVWIAFIFAWYSFESFLIDKHEITWVQEAMFGMGCFWCRSHNMKNRGFEFCICKCCKNLVNIYFSLNMFADFAYDFAVEGQFHPNISHPSVLHTCRARQPSDYQFAEVSRSRLCPTLSNSAQRPKVQRIFSWEFLVFTPLRCRYQGNLFGVENGRVDNPKNQTFSRTGSNSLCMW